MRSAVGFPSAPCLLRLCALCALCAFASLRLCLFAGNLLSVVHRQLDHKPCAAWIVLLGANSAAVLQDDPLNDGEPETRAAVTARKVRLKQAPKISGRDSLPRVGNFRAHPTSLDVMIRADRD